MVMALTSTAGSRSSAMIAITSSGARSVSMMMGRGAPAGEEDSATASSLREPRRSRTGAAKDEQREAAKHETVSSLSAYDALNGS